MILYYIRHGDPIYNPDSLTPLGHEQARALAKRLALYGIDEIYASSSNRAQLTAKPTCELLKKEMTILDWANEHNAWSRLGTYREDGVYTWAFSEPRMREKFLSPEVRALGYHWHTHPYFKDTKFSEAVEFIDRELDGFLLSLGYRHDRERCTYEAVSGNDKRVALFAHQGMGMSVLSSLLDIPYNIFSVHADICTTGMTVIKFDREGDKIIPKMLQLSNDSHLYREGILTGYNNGDRI